MSGVKPFEDRNEFLERRDDILSRKEFFVPAASKVVQQAKDIAVRGDGWGQHKAFISDVARELNTSVKRLAGLLLVWHNIGWIELARADLVGAMPFEKVQESEIRTHDDIATYHFIVV